MPSISAVSSTRAPISSVESSVAILRPKAMFSRAVMCGYSA